MSTAIDGLAAFFAARLDEDEAAAKACQSPAPWKAAIHPADSWIVTDAGGEPVIYDEGTPTLEEAAHIARHDPARVLADVEADRRILAMYEAQAGYRLPEEVAVRDALGEVVRVRAARFSSHPDYRKEWAP